MRDEERDRLVFVLQFISIGLIWVFVLGISVWIIHLLRLSYNLHDQPSTSFGISIVAIPIFLTGASVLTYVFIGLRKGRSAGGGGRK